MQVVCVCYAGFSMVLKVLWVCVWVFAAPCPPRHNVKAKPMLMLLIERHVLKTYVLAIWNFFGLEGPVLSRLTENGP